MELQFAQRCAPRRIHKIGNGTIHKTLNLNRLIRSIPIRESKNRIDSRQVGLCHAGHTGSRIGLKRWGQRRISAVLSPVRNYTNRDHRIRKRLDFSRRRRKVRIRRRITITICRRNRRLNRRQTTCRRYRPIDSRQIGSSHARHARIHISLKGSDFCMAEGSFSSGL